MYYKTTGAWEDTEPTTSRVAMCKQLFPYSPDTRNSSGFTYNDCWNEGVCINKCSDQPSADKAGCFNLCMMGKNIVTGFVTGASMGLTTKVLLAVGAGALLASVL